jgi:hypothetical protein
MWLDPETGLKLKRLRPWMALIPDVEPEPIRPAQPPVIVPAPDAKPMSYAERMAKMPYVPEPLTLTDAQIDEGAEFAAVRDEPDMPDAVLETLAEAWDTNEDSELHTITTLWGHVQSNGRVS